MGRRYSRYYGGRTYNAGYERAKQHIREAHEFSREVGGTDRDIKQYFFSLSPSELRGILDRYGQIYGASAKDYATQAIPRWKSGRTKMSGQTAKRLFDLLPERMPIQSRLNLVDSLWNHFKVKRTVYCRYGPESEPSEVAAKVQSYLAEHVRGENIPDAFKQRFTWLSRGDSATYQTLLNHYIELDRQRTRQAIEQTTEVVKRHRLENPLAIKNFRQTVEVNGVSVEIFFDPKATTCEMLNHAPRQVMKQASASRGGLVQDGWSSKPQGQTNYNSTDSGRSDAFDLLIGFGVFALIFGPIILACAGIIGG
ncbi:hypothetical protein ABWH91_05385 [Phycisphaerales bacterium ac7]